MAKPKLELLVFDNNGTMLDDLHLAYGSVEAIFRILQLPCPTKRQYREEVDSNIAKFCRCHGVPDHVTDERIHVVRELYYGARMDQAHFRPDLVQTLEHCASRGLSLVVCSAEIDSFLRGLLNRDGIAGRFDIVRAEAWPKTAALAEIIQSLDVRPEQAAYVDDTADGINAAREVGLRAIAFSHPTGYNSAERLWAQKPDHVVNDFTELRQLVTELTA